MVDANTPKTKKLLVALIGEFPGLSSTEYQKLLASKGRVLSRQGLHKFFVALREEGAIVKIGRGFMMNSVWLLQTAHFIESAQAKLWSSAFSLSHSTGKAKRFVRTCRSFIEADDVWTYAMIYLLKETKSKAVLQWHPSLWFLLLPRRRDVAFQAVFKQSGATFFEIIHTPTFAFEQALYEEFTFPHAHKSCGIDVAIANPRKHITIIGDYIVEVSLSASALALINQVMSNRGDQKAELARLLSQFPRTHTSLQVSVKHSAKEFKRYQKLFERHFGKVILIP